MEMEPASSTTINHAGDAVDAADVELSGMSGIGVKRTRSLVKSSVLRKHRRGVPDFTMIDWVHDIEAHKDYQRSRITFGAMEGDEMGGWRKMLAKLWLAVYGWVAILLIGIGVGMLAGMIHTCVDFLRDIKSGVCSDYFWLSSRNCCPNSSKEACVEWKSWGDYFAGEGIRASTSTTVLDFLAFLLFSTGYAVLAAWFVKVYAPYAAGSGIPEIKTILSGVRIKRYLGGWTLLIKCIGISLAVGAGLSLGMEGPFVHVASCVGNITAKFFKGFRYHESKRREIISAAVAAGVSVAFGAPIGGVLFSLEEASYYFPHKTMWRSFLCAIVAALLLKRVDPSGTGRLVLFQVDYNHQWHWFELVGFGILGVVGGVIGAGFNSLNTKWCHFRKKSSLKDWPIAEVCAVTVVTSIVNFTGPYMFEPAGEFIAELFKECKDNDKTHLCTTGPGTVIAYLVAAACLKLTLTVFTFGIRIPAGLFIPSLFTGACLGRALGVGIQELQSRLSDAYIFSECAPVEESYCIIPGVYAIVGAAAVLGGVTRMTISLVVIVFELTGGLEYLMPVMLAVLISKWVGEWVGTVDSIYEMHIELNGYPYLDPKTECDFQATAADFMVSSNIQVLTVDGWAVADINALLDGCDYNGFPVVMSHTDMRIVGYISRANLVRSLEEAGRNKAGVNQATEVLFYEQTQNEGHYGNCLDISLYLDPTPISVTPDTSVNRLLHIFKTLGVRTCLVSKNNRLVGLATRRNMLQLLKRAGLKGEGLK
ncbi:putative ankyrin repeat protein [Diplonema papillatum]|nr:putative ankyrin repeat protein [Diplonema papillatum]KAJ9464692.1 putative ankyrin repeat protein [Diplonema papillatum]|eukprot:gene12115-18727_t